VSATLPAYDAYLQHWPRFRGPTGSGAVTFPEIPTQWSVPDNEGLLWKTAVPLPGHNSPVVWEQRVFLSGATETEQAVFCFDADSGSLDWRHDVPPTPPETDELDVMDATGYAAPTTATDGLRVYAIFATGDVVAVSLDGQRQWHKYLGLPKNPYGHASSLATYEDLVIVQWDQGSAQAGLSRLIALRGATGEVAWEVPREVPASWASPIVVRHEGRWMVIVAVNPWLIAYSPTDGQELWRAKCLGGEVGPSPVFVDGVAYAANEMGGFAAVRADGSGDVTDTHVVWTTDIGVPDVCSPLVTDRFVLLISHGLLACFDREPADADPGDSEPREPLWEEDLLEEVSSSPSQVGDLIYLFSEEGKAWILRPGADACERLAELDMGEPVKASPAFQPGRMYVRGHDHLFCIGTR
jgi:outer membrane protein assembly factor BamB